MAKAFFFLLAVKTRPDARARRSVVGSQLTPTSPPAAQGADILLKMCQVVGNTCSKGPQGKRGQKGRRGPRGSQGIMGPPGRNGKQGMSGPPGMRGEKGHQGDVGPQGPPGSKGEPGESISPPHVIVSPSTVTVNESVTARLMCSVTGNPKPRIEWTKDGGSLPSDKTTVTDLGELQIHNVQIGDAGRYNCSAKNILGTAEDSGHLTVQGQ